MYNLLGSKNLELPYERGEGDLKEFLAEKFHKYNLELSEFIKENSTNIFSDVLKTVKTLEEQILETVDKYLNDDIANAHMIFNKAITVIEPSIMFISEYNKHSTFDIWYKARLCTEETPQYTTKEELFHIPFEKRHCVGNQRYSISGYPCIYLGATPYTCYEELGRPKEDKMYFVKMEIPNDYKLVTIGLLPYELRERLGNEYNEQNDVLLANYLKMLPLIMSCSIIVPQDRKSEVFKEEYIIPQLLMQWLITAGRVFDGILFFSTATKTHSRINYRLYQNIALPVKEVADSGYCKKLLNELKMTNPESASEVTFFKEYDYKYFSDFESDLPCNGRIREENNEIHYSASGFRLLECLLSKKVCEKLYVHKER